MISIITVTYNSAKYLSETIESIKNQSYSNIEYIIIDGGSDDGTIDIIKNNLDTISYWISEPDEGIYDAMNKGIMAASGEIIGIINSDDWLQPDAVESIVNKAKDIDQNEFVIHGKIATYDARGTFVTERGPKNYPSYQLFSTPFKHPAMFVTKRSYDKVGVFNTGCGLAADYDMMLRLFYSGVNGYFLNKVLTNVRLVGISTGGNSNATNRELYNIIKKNSGSTFKASIAMCGRVLNKKLKSFV